MHAFTRSLFAGTIQSELLFPYPAPLDDRNPDEAGVVRRLIGDLRGMEGTLVDSDYIDEEETIAEPVIRALADMGMLGLTIPKEYGGLGLSSTAYARVFAAVSLLDASVAVLIGVHCGLGSKAIVLFGNDEQKARYLPMLARGETLAAYALTEPETGSDAKNIKTTATLSDDGTRWLLNGRKLWIGNGHRAGVIATFAQTPVEKRGESVSRPTAFIIRPDMPGFRVLRTIRKMGIRGSTQAELEYTDLEVPNDHVLGQVGKGFTVAVNVLNAGRLSLASGCTAGSKKILTQMVAYAEQRVQFGHPLADFEITQRKTAMLAADCYAADAMLGVLCALTDSGNADIALEAACAKVFASELLWRAADEMVQLAGGRGFVKPYPYERMLRDSRINRIFEGANEVLRLFIALNGVQGPSEHLKEVGTALRTPIRSLGLLAGYAATRIRDAIGADADMEVELHERLAEHQRFFRKHVGELEAATNGAIARHRKEIIERQMVLERLANMGIEMFATAAVLARTQRLIDERGLDACAREIALCDLFCVESGRRFRRSRGAMESPQDDVRRTVALQIREAKGYFVADAVLDG
ncbi:MAG: acyl-CoA dehydrogenase family protein [Gemmatimonadota bacterium]|nr:acyl-CoA dehydrogenase family protein [Gemmatimonadota bacterium]